MTDQPHLVYSCEVRGNRYAIYTNLEVVEILLLSMLPTLHRCKERKIVERSIISLRELQISTAQVTDYFNRPEISYAEGNQQYVEEAALLKSKLN